MSQEDFNTAFGFQPDDDTTSQEDVDQPMTQEDDNTTAQQADPDPEWDIFEAFIKDGLSGEILNNDQKEWIYNEAWGIWKEMEATPRTDFVKRVEQYVEAKAVCTEAEGAFELQKFHGDFDNTVAPIIIQPVDEISDNDINTVVAYHRALETMDYALTALMNISDELLAEFDVLEMQACCTPFVQRLNVDVVAKGVALTRQRDWLDKICAKTEWVARAAAARPAVSSRFIIPDTGSTIWVPALDIGGIGKEGKLCLWVGYDREGSIIDRYVHKLEDNMSMTAWGSDGVGNRINMEYYLQDLCWKQDHHSFVKIRSCSFDGIQKIVDFKIEYCPFGDLEYQLRRFAKIYEGGIPEPMLWFIFHKLAEQCLIMERGSHDVPNSNWFQIVHRDIKLANFFMDLPTPGFFPQYPTPKLADFGFAFQTDEWDYANPINYWKAGTPLYLAPEQVTQIRYDRRIIRIPGRHSRRRPEDPETLERLLSPTNVWAMGMCMLQLVSEKPMDSRHQKRYDLQMAEEFEMTQFTEDTYSPELLDLIRKCMRFYPQDRISAEDLLGQIKMEMEAAPDGVGEYCRAAATGQQEQGGDFEWKLKREGYQLKVPAGGNVYHGPAGGNVNQGPSATSVDSGLAGLAL